MNKHNFANLNIGVTLRLKFGLDIISNLFSYIFNRHRTRTQHCCYKSDEQILKFLHSFTFF